MTYSTFNQKSIDATLEPMFFGENPNISRYDKQKYNIFEKLIEKQLSFFWRPEEVDLSQDRKDFSNLDEHEVHIFLSNLKYQILLDSVQGRAPNIALLPVVSIPEVETWVETWSFSETIHSRSYTHIIRNIVNDPAIVFDTIISDKNIINRATSVTKHYDDFIEAVNYYNMFGEGEVTIKQNGKEKKVVIEKRELYKKLYLMLISIYALEAIRFYVSFACSFSFAERGLMEGNAKIIRLIARDEALHANGTEQMIQLIRRGREGSYFAQIAKECESEAIDIFKETVEQEKAWAIHLFSKGSVIGLNAQILTQYLEYITDQRLSKIGFAPLFNIKNNPLPWMNKWLSSGEVQVAPQETEIVSYLIGAVNQENMLEEDFDGLEL
jgi:ribonucleoside-diphosphate reductase beta chain